LRLEQPQELVELVEFYIVAGAKELSKVDFFQEDRLRTGRLSSVFSGLHIAVRDAENRYILDLTKPGALQNLPEDLKTLAEAKLALFRQPFDQLVWLEAKLRELKITGRLQSESLYEGISKSLRRPPWEQLPSEGFLYRQEDEYAMRFGLFPVKPWEGPLERDWSYPLCIEGLCFCPNLKRSSVMFLWEFFTYTEEGKAAIEAVVQCGTLEEVVRKFTSQSVSVPAKVRQQIRFAIELRQTRQCLEDGISDVVKAREPAERILECTWRRLTQLSILKRSYQQEIDSILRPLPYFIEKPYRDFTRADPGWESIHSGLACASKIYKVMACLAIEEFEHNWPSSAQQKPKGVVSAIDEIDSGKPVSDGRWVAVFQRICQEASKDIPLMLSIGAGYYQKADKAFELIARRNKCWAHPDESDRVSRCDMISKLENKLQEILPMLIDVLRKGFENKEVLVPLNSRFKQGTGAVFEAKLAMGFDGDFKTVERPMIEGIDQYIDRELIMYAGNAFFPMRKHFRCKEIHPGFFEVTI